MKTHEANNKKKNIQERYNKLLRSDIRNVNLYDNNVSSWS